ncbi:MAG: gliding motility-associated C-terminal domain-containing protein, partial [Bacteroidia bacterium]|nr:gliding motility-associated C-terminal domain-containing protein [Bacteroidia bacterium]
FYNESTIGDNSPLSYIWTFPPLKPGNPDRKDYTTDPKQVTFLADTGNICVKLTAISEHGCYDSTINCVKIEPDITVFVPNVFYPPTEGKGGSQVDFAYGGNKTFKVSATGFETIEIFVFNRWGQMVYKTAMTSKTWDQNEGWNGKEFNTGKDCQQDSYIYQVNATSFNGKKYTYSGSLTLLR